MATSPDSKFVNLLGTSETVFRVGVSGFTIYQGTADPNVTPPTPLTNDVLNDGDVYIRTLSGVEGIWVLMSSTWTEIAAGGGVFTSDITMSPGAQILADGTAAVTDPAYAFSGDIDTGMTTAGAANTLEFVTGGVSRLQIESDGTLNVAGTANYETLITADDDIPNRLFLFNNFLPLSGGTLTGALTMGTGAIFIDNSLTTAGAPGLSVDGDPNTGIFWASADNLGFSAAGAERFRINSSGVVMATGQQFVAAVGTAGSPAITTSGDSNTGVYFGGSDDLFLATGGVARLSLTTSTLTSAVRHLNPDGTLALPSYSFSGGTAMGMWRDTTTLKFSVATAGEAFAIEDDGTLVELLTPATYATQVIGDGDIPNRLYVHNTFLPFTGGTMTGDITFSGGRIFADDTADNAGTPSYAFSGATTSGMYLTSGSNLGFSLGGVHKMSLEVSAMNSDVVWNGPDGSASAPALSFDSNPDFGFYFGSGINISIGGSPYWRFQSNGVFYGLTASATIAGTDTTSGNNITIRGGLSTGGGNTGGTAFVSGGTGDTTGAGGYALIRGGQGGTTGDGGVTQVVGGPSGTSGGNGGNAEITGGQAAIGSSGDGGDVLIVGGSALGSGTDGIVRVNSTLKLAITSTAALPGGLGAGNASEAGLLQFVDDDAGATSFVLAYSDDTPTWLRIDDNSEIS